MEKIVPCSSVLSTSKLPACPFGHNIIRQTEPQTRSLPGRFGGEKGLEDFVADGFGDVIAIVSIDRLRHPGKRHKTRVHLVEKNVRCACIHPIGFRLAGLLFPRFFQQIF